MVRIGEEDLSLAELIEQSTTGERKDKFAWELLEAPIIGTTPVQEAPPGPRLCPKR